MAVRGKQNTTKPNQTIDKTKITQLEQSKTAKISINNLEEDDKSVNIKQIEPKKIKCRIDNNTLASTYFSSASTIGNDSTKIKVSCYKKIYSFVTNHLLTTILFPGNNLVYKQTSMSC